jgi:hypothetical protein
LLRIYEINTGQLYLTAMIEPSSISHQGVEYECAVCDECGVKIFPPELLASHQDRETVKHLFFAGEIAKLQAVINRMKGL